MREMSIMYWITLPVGGYTHSTVKDPYNFSGPILTELIDTFDQLKAIIYTAWADFLP